MISHESSTGEPPGFKNETLRADILATVTSDLRRELELVDATFQQRDEAYAITAFYTSNFTSAVEITREIDDPYKRLMTLAQISHRAEDDGRLRNSVVEEARVAFGEPESSVDGGTQRNGKAYFSWVNISVALGDATLLRELGSFRDGALSRFALAHDNFGIVEEINSGVRNELTELLICHTDQDVSQWKHLLPESRVHRDVLLRDRTKWGHLDVAAANLIIDPIIRAQALLIIAEKSKGEIIPENIPDSLRQPDGYDELHRYIMIKEFERYMDISGDRAPVADLRAIAADESADLHDRIRAFAAVVKYTGEHESAMVALGMIDDLRERLQAGGFHFNVNQELSELAVGVNNTEYALRITSKPMRNDTILKIALAIGSIDPILRVDDVDDREYLKASYYVEINDLESARQLKGKQAREHALIGIALRRGEPEIARQFVSAEAESLVIDRLLDPDTADLISLDSLSLVEELDDYLKHLRKYHQAGEKHAAGLMVESITGEYEQGSRFKRLLEVARYTNDATYAYAALDDFWNHSLNPHRVEWGTHILQTIDNIEGSKPRDWRALVAGSSLQFF